MTHSTFWGKCLALAAAVCLSVCPSWADVNPKPFVVPELTQWIGAEGHTALSGRIIVKSGKLQGVAEALAGDYKEMFGRELSVVKGKQQAGDIILSLVKDKTLGTEGYKMDVAASVSLSAATEQGVFWATRTLLQMVEQHPDGALPRGAAKDVPQYKLRGFMIDCGRKFIPMSYLRNITKIMAYYKMNLLQVHLNDNGFRQYFGNDWDKTQAAFRLECETFPGLTAKDGSYTKAEFIDLQKLAEHNHVELLPEIDAPAHSLAFTHYKPEIGSKEYGMDHLDLSNPESYKFMDALWKEYIGGKDPVFRNKRVHIGTDEYSNAKKEVVEQFRAYTDHYIKYVESFGKKAVLWGALTHADGDTPVKADDVLMHIWYNPYADPVKMKEKGYQLVSIPDGLVYIVPAAGYYYDYLNTQHLYENWTPAQVGGHKFEENDPSIEGGMFAVWNDIAGNGITTKDIHHRVFPALQTLSAKCWTGKLTSLPYSDFDRSRHQLSEAPGVNELGRLSAPGTVALEKAALAPGETLAATEIGYNYAVTFTIDGKSEEKGTVLLSSPNAKFYLADPKSGKLGFEREGYLSTFNYAVQPGEKHTLTIEGTNKSVRLLVDGKLREELGVKTLYMLQEKDRAHYQVDGAYTAEPVMYDPSVKISFQNTLFFPLQQAGSFKSTITGLKVESK